MLELIVVFPGCDRFILEKIILGVPDWLSRLVEHVTLDLRSVSLSPMLAAIRDYVKIKSFF